MITSCNNNNKFCSIYIENRKLKIGYQFDDLMFMFGLWNTLDGIFIDIIP